MKIPLFCQRHPQVKSVSGGKLQACFKWSTWPWPGNAFDYQDSQGYYPLRSSVRILLEKRKIACHEENIQIISGAQQGIDIIAKALLRQGDYVITESPTYTGGYSGI